MKKLKTSETAMVKQKAPGLKQIELCADGKYRWIYEFNMLKNPTIFFTVLNIFGVLILVQVFLMVILGLKDGDSLLDVLGKARSAGPHAVGGKHIHAFSGRELSAVFSERG